MDMSKLSPIYQKGLFAARKPFVASKQAGDLLSQISSQMIDDEQKKVDLTAAAKSREIGRDIYTESNFSRAIDGMPTALLEVALGAIRSDFYMSQRFTQNLAEFKEQLSQHDQAIQGYQDMLTGKSEIPNGFDNSMVERLHKSAQEQREQFLQENIAQYNTIDKNYRLRDTSTTGATSAILRTQNHSQADDSAWQIDTATTGIYAEIDRVLEMHQDVSKMYAKTMEQIHNELYMRGEKHYLRGGGSDWLDWTPTPSNQELFSEEAVKAQFEAVKAQLEALREGATTFEHGAVRQLEQTFDSENALEWVPLEVIKTPAPENALEIEQLPCSPLPLP